MSASKGDYQGTGMAKMVPDKLAGQDILRPVQHGGDGVPYLASTSVFFPPTIHIKEPLEAMVEKEANSIVAMRAMTTSELRLRLYNFAKRVLADHGAPNG